MPGMAHERDRIVKMITDGENKGRNFCMLGLKSGIAQ
jgi:hypothetical protein